VPRQLIELACAFLKDLIVAGRNLLFPKLLPFSNTLSGLLGETTSSLLQSLPAFLECLRAQRGRGAEGATVVSCSGPSISVIGLSQQRLSQCSINQEIPIVCKKNHSGSNTR
jgi:hypothetical protein